MKYFYIICCITMILLMSSCGTVENKIELEKKLNVNVNSIERITTDEEITNDESSFNYFKNDSSSVLEFDTNSYIVYSSVEKMNLSSNELENFDSNFNELVDFSSNFINSKDTNSYIDFIGPPNQNQNLNEEPSYSEDTPTELLPPFPDDQEEPERSFDTPTLVISNNDDNDIIEQINEVIEIPAKKIITVVYKPSTHYVHRSTCHWVTDECYEISNTNDIEARKCSECNPDIEIVNEYKEPVKEITPVEETPTYGIDSYSRQLLAEIVWHEYGSDWVSIPEKARIAAGVMNRVNDSRFPNTVYEVLVAPGQFTGYWPGCCTPTQACYDAVDYYFAHTNEFNSDNSWWGDSYQNHFYYQ